MTARYDNHTALIVVDMQNDFADPTGSLYVSGGEDVLGPVNDEIRRAKSGGALVVYTQDWHPPDTPHFEKDGGIWPVHCVKETWGADFIPGLEVDGPVIQKGIGGEDGYSGFTIRDPESGSESATGLADMLRQHGINRVVVVGLALDYCVKATALDAVAEEFDATMLEHATRPVNLAPDDGAQAIAELRAANVEIL